MISSFDGEYRFLSNFYDSLVFLEGRNYPSVEAAFQAAKTLDLEKRKEFQIVPPNIAKRMGRQVALRLDWEEVKDSVMLSLLRDKFSDRTLREKLLNTRDLQLIEGNTWHDNYWGSCTCPKCNNKGQNKLGQLLMQVREELRAEDV